MEKLKQILENHKNWLKDNTEGVRADLRSANLSSAYLSSADLDFSCWPLWCGSLDVTLDTKQKRQLLYHVLAVAPEYRTPELIEEANKFHRVGEVPELII